MKLRSLSMFAAAATCMAVLSACATHAATFAQKDPQVDVYDFKTFAFYDSAAAPRPGTRYSTLVGERLKHATREQLEHLGYVYDESNPDLRVNIMLSVRERAEVRSVPAAGVRPYRAWDASGIETRDYREGTLAVDVVDARRRAMVWRGVSQDRITHKHLQNVDKAVHEAVRELFINYPRKA
jgi:hypothetical protein